MWGEKKASKQEIKKVRNKKRKEGRQGYSIRLLWILSDYLWIFMKGCLSYFFTMTIYFLLKKEKDVLNFK